MKVDRVTAGTPSELDRKGREGAFAQPGRVVGSEIEDKDGGVTMISLVVVAGGIGETMVVVAVCKVAPSRCNEAGWT